GSQMHRGSGARYGGARRARSRGHRDAGHLRAARDQNCAIAEEGRLMKKLDRNQMAARVARDIPEGSYVNLGIGLPTLVADHLPKGKEIILHSENGVLGIGPKPPAGQEDEDLINAGKEPVTLLSGGSYFHHA